MIDDLSPAAVVRRLDRGQQVVIPSSIRHSLLLMLPVLVIGIGLLAFFILVVHATIEDGRSPWLIIINLRMWALAVGTIGCLVVAPIGLFVRMRRRESLVLSPSASRRPGAIRCCPTRCCRGRISKRSCSRRRHAVARRSRRISSPRKRAVADSGAGIIRGCSSRAGSFSAHVDSSLC